MNVKMKNTAFLFRKMQAFKPWKNIKAPTCFNELIESNFALASFTVIITYVLLYCLFFAKNINFCIETAFE